MKVKLFIILILVISLHYHSSAQIKIRVFANQTPESAVFSITGGEYEINSFTGNNLTVKKGTLIIISKLREKIAVKVMNEKGFVCDSILFTGKTGNDSFSLRINEKTPVRQFYSGDLHCFPDLTTLVFINIPDIETYIAGVVKAEGGSGKNIEYFKTQAIIARTYMYRYFDKHLTDRYNLCDNTHCQAFNGITSDSLIIRAARETAGQVILAPDSTLIISAFHSNCGGETSSSEDVWLTGQTYLKKVTDPYCLASRNAKWQAGISLTDWLSYLKKNGYSGKTDDITLLNFSQLKRLTNYRIGDFTIPLRQIRTDLNLRSTFFSLYVEGDSVIFKGRGYGHGVGLCQEGAMVMASKGFDYKQIINFYYTGVFISDVKNAVNYEVN
ncbi:MAG: SpoIID/LytB domain-containing protein [Bacteroidia bacterium]|nr:SpoIID/LytB domain-containing protein [Bacteroidia bacterium]